MGGALLVAGTTSDAGKSVLTAGICRWLYRRGVKVAPFKAQNMSNNSVVVPGAGRAESGGLGQSGVEGIGGRGSGVAGGGGRGSGVAGGGGRGSGGEIGRAQAMQAAACGLAPDVRFNPVLLKPGSDMSSQVVVLGQAIDTVTAGNYRQIRKSLAATAFSTLAELRDEFDAVICEGAGSPAEINLRDGDFVNMGLARAADMPAIVVGDIDRGGVFAALFGTVALLSPEDQAHVAGFVINKFRGDRGLLQPGLDMITKVTDRPVLGVLPYASEVWLDGEDSLAYGRVLGRPAGPRGTEWLRVAVVRLPRISNATDAEALATEPGVRVQLTVEPADLDAADLVVLPGSKATVSDLAWLRETGLADAVLRHAAAGKPVLGICGGFQMLGRAVHDDVESGRGTVAGLGLLPTEVTFRRRKTLNRSEGYACGAPVAGYEIHHGEVTAGGDAEPFLTYVDGRPEGAVAGPVSGTHWHGAFESDEFRRRFLTAAAARAGRHGFVVAPDTCFSRVREKGLDLLGDLVEQHLDTDALWRLVEGGAPAGLRVLPPGAP